MKKIKNSQKTEENDSNENNKSNSFEEESDNNKKIIKEEENYSNIMMNVEKEVQLKLQQYEDLYNKKYDKITIIIIIMIIKKI